MVDVNELVPKLIRRVENPLDMNSWREAFPETDFPDVDEGFTGDPIDWEGRTSIEKAIYVAYMADPQRTKVEYQIEVDGFKIRHQIDDSKRIWYMWMRGCWTTFEDGKGKVVLSDEAKTTLLYYAAQSARDFEEMIMERYDSDDVMLLELDMQVAEV